MSLDLLKDFSALVLQRVAAQVRLPGEPATTSVQGTLAGPLWTDERPTTGRLLSLTNYSSYLLHCQNGSYGSAVQRLVLLQPPLSAERGRAATVAAGEQPQPGAADARASVHAVHRPATANSSDCWYNNYLLGAAARVCRSYRFMAALD